MTGEDSQLHAQENPPPWKQSLMTRQLGKRKEPVVCGENLKAGVISNGSDHVVLSATTQHGSGICLKRSETKHCLLPAAPSLTCHSFTMPATLMVMEQAFWPPWQRAAAGMDCSLEEEDDTGSSGPQTFPLPRGWCSGGDISDHVWDSFTT